MNYNQTWCNRVSGSGTCGMHTLANATASGNVKTVVALLENGISEPELTSHDVKPSKIQALDSGLIGTCNSLDRLLQLLCLWAVYCGEVNTISRGGSISDRHFIHFCLHLSTALLLVRPANGASSCEACGIKGSGGCVSFFNNLDHTGSD